MIESFPSTKKEPGSQTSPESSTHPDIATDAQGTPATLLSLAHAVAQPHARAHLYRGSSNALSGWCSIEEAVTEKVAFVVRLGSHVVGIDLDQPHETAHLPGLLTLLQRRGLSPVVVASGRPEGRHVFVRVDPRERAALVEDLIDLLGARTPIRRDIRPPLAPHRGGLHVRLVEPSTIEQAVERLRPLPAERRLLPAHTFRLLRKGDVGCTFDGDRSRVVMSLVTSMVAAGWSEEAICKTLLDSQNAGGAKVREIASQKGLRAAQVYVAGRYDKAVEWIAKNPTWTTRQEVVAALVDHRSVVEANHWTGSEGQKQLVVLRAVLEIAIALGSTTVHPSHRRLAEVTGLDRKTLSNLLSALSIEGWLLTTDPSRGRTQAYTVHLKKKGSTSTPPSISPLGGCERSGPRLDSGHDAFRHGAGLGKSGMVVLTHLHEPFSVHEVVERTGLSESTVKRMIDHLMDSQLVDKIDTLYQAKPGLLLAVGLGVHAREHGTHLKGLRQRAGHQKERLARNRERPERSGSLAPREGPQGAVNQGGLIDPVTGTFTWLRGPLRPGELPQVGTVEDVVLSFRYKGWPMSIMSGGREVVWVSTKDPTSRDFEVLQHT